LPGIVTKILNVILASATFTTVEVLELSHPHCHMGSVQSNASSTSALASPSLSRIRSGVWLTEAININVSWVCRSVECQWDVSDAEDNLRCYISKRGHRI